MMIDTGLSKVSSDSIFKILSTPPVLNDGAIFTVLMSAADPTLLYWDSLKNLYTIYNNFFDCN